ncbi:Thiol-disulfide isomerase or thioredoxin [Haloechinothrix alba]|uniref:Thiol-disulfide isomerase or thioredoxin n=1 Tax=Haloechinothrix alba TaxID=664784 RepID=A0A238XWQ1_9PSEU|nr:TlpA disulfide reductase family protein [Haloechinothrix alba]SNR62998.1 Thiol-disulfide isomerase or thioredoxin [Haloechinothrix alba]
MSTAARWALACGALVLAAVVALLPLVGEDSGAGDDTRPDPPDESGLERARQDADLRPCPTGGRATAEVDDLAGVRATCLGDGERVALGAALAGEATLINVWATWCGPCREELPVLQEYARSQDRVNVLGVQVESDPVDGLEMLTELGVRFPSVHDGTGSTGAVRDALGVPRALPASYFVSPGGDVTFITDPRVFYSVDDVREGVEAHGGGT